MSIAADPGWPAIAPPPTAEMGTSSGCTVCTPSRSRTRSAAPSSPGAPGSAAEPGAQKFFQRGLQQAQAYLSDEHFTVDGTLIEAWASQKSFQNYSPTLSIRRGSIE